ncbi:MAG: NADH-quinone oxidoreductase subunit C [Anaerolineales bacterium]|nr:NADH-quinone oxidoreductase subunit C [Anaerolineales bacterium]
MNAHLEQAIQALKARFKCPENIQRGEHTLILQPNQLVAATTQLRDQFGFNLLASLTATDYWPELAGRFHVSYQFYSIPHNIHLRLRVPLDDDAASLPTLVNLFPNANWHERELYDMFGIHIEDHPDLRRILMPYEWEGHPLRKDYPLGYEEPQFTFNFEEIDQRKPYVKE